MMRIAVIAATAALVLAAAAAPPTASRLLSVMHERHEGMESIGNANKAIHRELDGSFPNLAIIRSSAAKIAVLSQKASGWFPTGSGPELGKTGAKPEIWQDTEDFTTKLRHFQLAAKVFNGAAAAGNLDATRAQFATLGGTCKACHDKYRAEMKH
jgi:cytochrome c556